MIDDQLDFRFMEVLYELEACRRFVDCLEEQLPIIEKDQQERTIRTIDSLFLSMLASLVIFESAITEIAEELKKKQDQSLGLNDIRGDFLTRSKNYFTDVLKFPFLRDNQEWQGLRRIMTLRNVIAHENGRIEGVKGDVVNKINEWEQAGIGLSIEMDRLMLSEKFLRDSSNLISQVVREVIKRVEEAYPNVPK